MAFASLKDRYSQAGPPSPYRENFDMSKGPGVTVPEYKAGGEDLDPSPWDVRHWGWKKWTGVGVVLAIVIIVAAVAASLVTKANKYPDYTTLNYSLAETYSGTDFFDQFDYFTGYDPSDGFVHYVPADTASQYNLTYASSSSAILRVDTSVTSTSDPNASTGRYSVRITSKTQYNDGLFIFDVIHTPIGCGTWPALWTSDPDNWPTNGEIDIMEAVNVVTNTKNQMTLHTSEDCTMKSVKRKETGTILDTSCVNSTNDNAGCGVDAAANTFGTDYNDNGGGIMAMELRDAGIRLWQFARSAIPADITDGTPNPNSWGEATADFPSTDCDIQTHFKNQSIIANIDLCGSWAGTQSIYSENCSGTCEDQVANNATAFVDSYWEFGYFKVYTASV